MTLDKGYYNKYYYEGGQLKRSEEYDSRNRLALSHTYAYNAQQQLSELITQVLDPLEEGSTEIKRSYTYDNWGNVTEEKMSVKQPGKEVYTLASITRYEGYDQQKSAENLTEFYPYLPQIKMNVNNPGKRIALDPDGNTIRSTQTYTYQYNEQGYPSRKTVQTQSGATVTSITATYQYE
ncbi:hypothetical protein GCM10023187_17960 [Nibrella viscosa]|uniref:YD repeat-containing protein n=1 Tax=Nibrella viscosa TaxID=1084524 RepID=A0ABP8K9N1_9BACT